MGFGGYKLTKQTTQAPCNNEGPDEESTGPLPPELTENKKMSAPRGSLLDAAATASIQSMMGTEAPPTREALALLIQENTALIASGDKQAMAAALSRQATALEIGCHGLLSAMARATNPEHRLTLAKAAATLHRACLSALSAVHQVRS